MEWPTATIILGIIGTIATAIIKLAPQKVRIEDLQGHKCATKEDIVALTKLIDSNNVKQEAYLHTRFHDLINSISPIALNLEILKDRIGRNLNRDSRDDN